MKGMKYAILCSALSLVFYVITLSRIENNKDGLNE